jgi:hypothetical protein
VKKLLYNIILVISFLGIPLFIYGLIGIGISLQYEVENRGDCISLVNGQDLCFMKNLFIVMVVLCTLAFITLLALKSKIIK